MEALESLPELEYRRSPKARKMGKVLADLMLEYESLAKL